MATEEEIREIKRRVNIKDIASQYLKLKKSGKNFRAKCPFHQEDNPSFTISPEKNLFHCFGCGEGGDVFKFLMKIENIDFPEAVRRLAVKAGVRLSRKDEKTSRSSKLKRINKQVAEYFHRNLLGKSGRKAKSYLESRGFTQQIVNAFKLGYAQPGWDNLIKWSKSGNSPNSPNKLKQEDLLTLSLISKSSKGGYYDYFRDRLIFPIYDIMGDIIGFAGRSLPVQSSDSAQKGPKYLNISNTPLFKKGTILYGLNFARQSNNDQLILMEGYTDVIAAHKIGFKNACAQMGTALTKKQVDTIKRYFDQVIITYDMDLAGQKAALKGMILLRNAGLKVKVALLPKESDPDDILQKEGKRGFEKFLKEAVPFHRFFLSHLEESYDLGSVEGKEKALSEAKKFIKNIKSACLTEEIIEELASLTKIPYEDVKMAVKRSDFSLQPAKSDQSDDGESDEWWAEDYLLYFLFSGDLTLDRLQSEFEPQDFTKYECVMDTIYEIHESRDQFDLDLLLEELDTEEENLITHLTLSQRDFFTDKEKAICDNISKLRCACINRNIEHLHQSLKQAEEKGDEKKINKLSQDLSRLQKQKLKEIRGNNGGCGKYGP